MKPRALSAVVLAAGLLLSAAPLFAAAAPRDSLVFQIKPGANGAYDVTGAPPDAGPIVVTPTTVPLEIHCLAGTGGAPATDCTKLAVVFAGQPVTLQGDAALVKAQLTLPASGSQELAVSSPDHKSILKTQVVHQAAQRLSGGLCSAAPRDEMWLVIALCVLYWLAMVVVRWNRVARPTRELLSAEITSLETKLGFLNTAAGAANLTRLLGAARSLIGDTGRTWKNALPRLANFLFWSRGQEITGWGYVHETETQMAQFLPDETVTAQLQSVQQQLQASSDAPCRALADAIQKELGGASSLAGRRALLAEALSAYYQSLDNVFADLVSWQNKTSWLVGCGLVLMIALTGAIPHHSLLLLVGATGGLLSRLSRSLDRKDVPTDYGASWTTLFLSPVAGALGAWAGILVAGLAVKLNVLGSDFDVNWIDPCQMPPLTLAVALLFGFSERLLDSVLDKAEGKALGGSTADTTSTPAKKDGQAAPGATPDAAATKLPAGKVNVAYSAQLQAPAGTGQVTWSLKAGSTLPTNLTLNGQGLLAGIPTAAGTFPFTAVAAGQGGSKDLAFSLVIEA
jgi:hypothetical protein